jgi:mono/diheme cytochrome c family protein
MKRKISPYFFTALMLLLFTNTIVPDQKEILPDGKLLFEGKCARCHGKDGTRGLLGAKNLQTSNLPDAELINVVSKGRRIMPAWRDKLSRQEIQSVVAYIKTLRH